MCSRLWGRLLMYMVPHMVSPGCPLLALTGDSPPHSLMSAILVCPIDGCLPGDNGTDTSKTNNVVQASGLDVNGNAVHCPVCGSAMVVADQTHVQTVTGVASAAQHPVDIDFAYVTQSTNAEGQQGTKYTPAAGYVPVYEHSFAESGGAVSRGTATVAPETVNTVAGP